MTHQTCKALAFYIVIYLFVITATFSQQQRSAGVREHVSMDEGWRFAFGHPYDTKKDFGFGTAYFSYLAKAGFGDGAAAAGFDDRSWRKLDLPHDWAVEAPFDKQGSYSHGFKAIGRNFPGASIGWYRKHFSVPASDLGRYISIAFDGVFRNCMVWVNGQYLGTQASGYLGFEYDISACLNYGGENTIAVRVDATMEEGWFYEGAGIYRHVWLNKTSNLHVAPNGTFVTTQGYADSSMVHVAATIDNDAVVTNHFTITQSIVDTDGAITGVQKSNPLSLPSYHSETFSCTINVPHPTLWSFENPHLYLLKTVIQNDSGIVDIYYTKFGIRTIRFDNNEGFFLNGKHVKIMGTNNHQDHAGVGTAMPDALQDFRIKTLKSFGCNAYRCSHNPPTPELLDACDRLGMLVIDENRLMGTTQTQLGDLKKMMERDRNHPCVISWSIGNEEWGIENNITGARIAGTMQAFVKSVDSTRPATAAFSGGIGSAGITTVMNLLGINYVINKNTDEQHRLFPEQVIWGTEEGSTNATRGAYSRDDEQHVIPAYDKAPGKNFLSIEDGWKHYATRPYLAGMFIWTGFDYRGEPTPYGWPSISSYFGMLDLCGFPKDDTWYLKSWWTKDTILHLLPHWNWPGKEGKPIEVWAYSNCDAVELFLNKKSLGKKAMLPNGHLVWMVNYAPGILEATGYKNGKKVVTDKVQTTKEPVVINTVADRTSINADGSDLSLISVDTKDKNGLHVPTADNEIFFSIEGPGKIIGVGNGNPTSLEPDKYLEDISVIKIDNLKEKAIDNTSSTAETATDYNDAGWKAAFTEDRNEQFASRVKALAYRGSFLLPAITGKETVTLFYNCIGAEQSLYINGKKIAGTFTTADQNGYLLEKAFLHAGYNSIAIIATPLIKKHSWDNVNTDVGLIQIVTPAQQYKRKLFNGLAQVIVQSTHEAGTIVVKAASNGLKPSQLSLHSIK